MLPASDLAKIVANLAALNLQPNTTAAVLGAILSPLLRSANCDPDLEIRKPRTGRPEPEAERRRAGNAAQAKEIRGRGRGQIQTEGDGAKGQGRARARPRRAQGESGRIADRRRQGRGL